MRKYTVRLAVAAFVLLAGHDRARSGDLVPPAVINHWLDLAQQIRAMGFCLYKPSDPALSLSRSVQENFARGVNDETIAQRTAELEGTVKRCSFCRTYAKLAVSASADNILYGCGFKGPLWSTNEAYHFNGCMTVQHCDSGGVDGLWGIYACNTPLEDLEAWYLNPDTADRTQKIAECKLTHTRVDCRSCHQSQSSAALQSMPKGGSSTQDALRRLSKPTKTSVTSSGNDLAKPSGENARRSGSAQGGNSSAMDRLGGGSQRPDSGADSKLGDGSRRMPAGGAAPAATNPAVYTPAPSRTIDFGTGVGIGRPIPAPR